MFVEEIRRAIPAMPRVRLAELSAAVWKGFACGAIGEEDAQQLAEEIAAHKAGPLSSPKRGIPRRVGSRPRTPEHVARRRRWTGSGWLPPALAARFTMAETAVLSAIASEVARRGLCRLTIGHIAVLAGVSRSTVKTAVRQAVALGILTSEEWRLTAWRSAPNTVRIVSPEWRTWLRMRDRKRAGGDQPWAAETGFETRNQPAVPVRKGGVRFSTTLRITDSSSLKMVKRKPKNKKSGREKATIGRDRRLRSLVSPVNAGFKGHRADRGRDVHL